MCVYGCLMLLTVYATCTRPDGSKSGVIKVVDHSKDRMWIEHFKASWADTVLFLAYNYAQEKITDSHFWIVLGIYRIPIKIPNLAKWDKSQPGNSQPSSQIGTCLTLPNLGFSWVFFKYPKISKNGNLLFFPVYMAQHHYTQSEAWRALCTIY